MTSPKRNTRPKSNGIPTPEQFIEAWQTLGSVQEVAAKLGMRERSATMRAMEYRKKGIPLVRKTSRGRPKLDIGSLSSLAKKLAPKE
jgi:hypothetical protein